MAVVVIVLSMLLAVGLVSVFGLPGMVIWLCIYGLFHLAARALLHHIGDESDVPTGRSASRTSAPTTRPSPPPSRTEHSSSRPR